jgi:hypothetical protein
MASESIGPKSLAEELFWYGGEVRVRVPEERLWRLVEWIFDRPETNSAFPDANLELLTWDYYDCSVEIYLDVAKVPDKVDLTSVWKAGFHIAWVHPSRCIRNGRRDPTVCKCPSRKAREEMGEVA